MCCFHVKILLLMVQDDLQPYYASKGKRWYHRMGPKGQSFRRHESVMEAYCQDHCIAQDLYEVLVQEAHIPGPKEAKRLWPILLYGYELLQGRLL